MNNNENNNSSSKGIGFFGVLAIVFIVLKLTKVINWSWWLVLLPIWGWLAIMIIAIVGYGIISYIEDKE